MLHILSIPEIVRIYFTFQHYNSIMKYMSKGPMLVDVHMHKPTSSARHFMDALLAFWPGLQVLKGDISPAIKTHEMLYQVIQRHHFLPEVTFKIDMTAFIALVGEGDIKSLPPKGNRIWGTSVKLMYFFEYLLYHIK